MRAAARQNLKEMQALVPQIQSRLEALDKQQREAEERNDLVELHRISEESADLQNALRLIRHHEEEPI
jgi:uncharacterized membrane protein (DUF106 family)